MRKLKLSLDSLQVTSFDTAAAARAGAGTVLAHSAQTSVQSPCRFSEQPGCVPITGPCTGPGCDITLAISCVECASVDGEICP